MKVKDYRMSVRVSMDTMMCESKNQVFRNLTLQSSFELPKAHALDFDLMLLSGSCFALGLGKAIH
jgi:hypothetical protein